MILYGMCMQHKLCVWIGIDGERPYMPGDRLQRNGGLQKANENCTRLTYLQPPPGKWGGLSLVPSTQAVEREDSPSFVQPKDGGLP